MNTIQSNKFFAILLLSIVVIFSANAHTPGPDYIYECPNCSNLLRKPTLMSGNTFWATFYSDGRMNAPMLPDLPDLTKCRRCDTVLWLSYMEKIGYEWFGRDGKAEWRDADRAEFLDVADLARFLEWDLVKNDQQRELTVRQRIWWTFNDRTRQGKDLLVDENEEGLWRSNCLRLIELLDMRNIHERFIVAELYRNLGKFEESIALLNTIIFEEHRSRVELLIDASQQGNKLTLQL